MRPVDIVVLSKFPEIFAGFKESVDRDAPDAHKIVVWDNSEELFTLGLDPPWQEENVVKPFQIAFNANHGWMQANSENDILYVGDDVRFVQLETIERLQRIAEDFAVGILSPQIEGKDEPHDRITTVQVAPYVPFVCVLIRREVIDHVGFLDRETFFGYGVEDIDYCYRTRKKGFRVAYAPGVRVQHGVGGHAWGSTFKRVITEDQRQNQDAENWRRFREKHGMPNDATKMWEAIRKA